ncbi:hypothetical protein CRYUN_Cryun30bG0067100 [Craigia yunnanensis]
MDVSAKAILRNAQLVKLFGIVGAHKLEWKLHRLECLALAKLDKERRKSVTSTIRMMVKLYLRRKLQNENVIRVTAMDNYNLVEALVSHMSDIDEKQLLLYAKMANLVNLILQCPDIDIKEIAENFSKFAFNAHTICDGELRPLRTGLYPVVSIINHSCLPNAVLVFEGGLAVEIMYQDSSSDLGLGNDQSVDKYTEENPLEKGSFSQGSDVWSRPTQSLELFMLFSCQLVILKHACQLFFLRGG